MTCIVGMIEDNTVYIGGDSQGSTSYSKTIREDKKVFRVDDFIFGCTTSYRMIQLLQYELEVPEQKPKQSDHEYMVTTFVDKVRKLFKEKGFSKTYDDGQDKGGLFLVGYKGVLYKVEHDFQVAITGRNYDACGSGGQVAMGALEVLQNELITMTPQNKLTKAINAAAEHVPSVGGPVDIITDTYDAEEHYLKDIENVVENLGLDDSKLNEIADKLLILSGFKKEDDLDGKND